MGFSIKHTIRAQNMFINKYIDEMLVHLLRLGLSVNRSVCGDIINSMEKGGYHIYTTNTGNNLKIYNGKESIKIDRLEEVNKFE